MSDLIDNVARILATPMPRRKAMKLFGGALAAAIVALAGAQPVKAATCTQNSDCTGNGKVCCQGTCVGQSCCVSGVKHCTGQCACPDGTCSSSTGGNCTNAGCTLC